MKKRLKGLLLAVTTVAFAAALAVPALAMADEVAGSDFADVEGTEWFAEDVAWANGEGLMTGTGDGTYFEPMTGTSRAMFVTSLYRLEGEPAPEGADARVPEGKWYTDAVLWALEAGVLKGYDDGELGLNDVLTREQAAVFAYRYAEYKGYDLSEGEDTNILSYLDANRFGSWAVPAVQWACGEGIILGYTGADGELTGFWGPKDPANRAMAAAILHRLVDNVVVPNTPEVEELAPTPTPVIPLHSHSYGDWVRNNDGTHTHTCIDNDSTETAACTLSGFEACPDCGYTDGKYHISAAAELVAFAAAVNAGNTFEGKTVVLDDDIDLTNVEWTPIGNGQTVNQGGVNGKAVFDGHFDGNERTISGLSFEGSEYVGLFGLGWTHSSIENVFLENVTLSGNHYVGAIVGYTYGNIAGCSVVDFEIVATPNKVGNDYDNGDKVGGIAGWASCGEISNCSVDDGSIFAYRDAGGILGANIADDTNAYVADCKVSNVTITVDQIKNGYGYKALNTREVIGRIDGGNVGEGNVAENVKIVAKVSNSEGLRDAISNGIATVTLGSGTYQMPASAKGKTLTISGTQDAVIEVVPGGQGEAGGQLDYSLDGSTVTFNGVTIKTNSQLYAGYARLNAVYNDCVIQNTYNLSTGASEFKNCVFNITNEYLRVGGASSAVFDGCTFNTDGRAILVFQDGTNVDQTVTVKDCTFNATVSAYTWNNIHVAAVSIDGSRGGTYVVNLEGKNVVDANFNGLWQIKAQADPSNVTVNGGDSFTKTNYTDADGVTHVSSNTKLEGALKADAEKITVSLLADVTYDVAAWQAEAMGSTSTEDIVIDGNGHTIDFAQTNSDWNNIVTNGATLTIKNAHITNSVHNNGPWNRHDINFNCKVVLDNVTSDKALAFQAGATLKGVTINDPNTSDTYAIWIRANGQEVSLDGCVIDMINCSDGRGIAINDQYIVDSSAKVTLSVANTTFKTEEKGAIIVKSKTGADITLSNINIAEVAADSVNPVWVDSDRSDYYDLVSVTGGSKVQEQ